MDLDEFPWKKNQNKKAIKDILAYSKCQIQLGGGIRTLKNIKEWLEL